MASLGVVSTGAVSRHVRMRMGSSIMEHYSRYQQEPVFFCSRLGVESVFVR